MQHIYSFSNYGGKHMKKITEKRAIELINMGLFPKCEVSRETFRPVKSISELEHFKSLSNVQSYCLWGYTDEEIASFHEPKGCLKLTIDDAYRQFLNKKSVYAQKIGNIAIEFTNFTSLMKFCKEANFNGTPLLLYSYTE